LGPDVRTHLPAELNQVGPAITPHWVRYYELGTGRMPPFLQELAERSQS
jgi:hypothetical protein